MNLLETSFVRVSHIATWATRLTVPTSHPLEAVSLRRYSQRILGRLHAVKVALGGRTLILVLIAALLGGFCTAEEVRNPPPRGHWTEVAEADELHPFNRRPMHPALLLLGVNR